MFSYGSRVRRFLVFGEKFRQVRQNCTLCVRMRLLSELFFLWFFWVSLLFSDSGKNILNIGAKSWEKLSNKGAFYLNNTLFEESLFSEENIYINIFFEFWWQNSADICRKAFLPIWKTAFYTRSEDLLGKHCHFPRENSLLQTEFEGNCLDFCENFLTWWLKMFFFVSRGHVWRNSFLFHKIFRIFSCFWDFEKNISDFRR